MDQTETSVTIINTTEDFLKSQILEKDTRIQSLEEHVSRVTQRSYVEVAETNRMRNSMQEWTLEQLSDEEITESQAEEIAEICGFDLTKEVEVEVSVTYSMTVKVPHNEDVESIVNDIDFDTVSYNDDNISWFSSSVDRIDF